MKKVFFILFIGLAVLSCKDNAKEDNTATENNSEISEEGRTDKQSDGLTLLKGDFVYLADAAVLQTHRDIYAVVINKKMLELDSMVKKYKQEDTDMISVEVRGKIIPKPANEEGWPYRVEIVEILSVSKPDPNKNDVVKLGGN